MNINAPGTVAWTLWIPQPERTMPMRIEGALTAVGTAETSYGRLLNITGTGSGRVRFSTAEVAFGANPFQLVPPVSLTGRDGQGPNGSYRIWRQSSDPAANITLSSSLPFSAVRLDESYQCGGVGFYGYPQEGWNALPMLFGDCVGLLVWPPGVIPTILLVPGVAFMAADLRRRRREQA